jgi:hypothetical protein
MGKDRNLAICLTGCGRVNSDINLNVCSQCVSNLSPLEYFLFNCNKKMKMNPNTTVKLFPCDHEVIG